MDRQQQGSRIDWIDVAKGIGIFLVVVGHSFRDEMLTSFIGYDYIKSLIYYFHMPLFFTISGFLLEASFSKRRQYNQLVLKKVKTLLVPFLSYSLLIYAVFQIARLLPMIGDYLSTVVDADMSFSEYLVMMLIGNNPYAIHLWYLLVLFLLEIVAIVFSFIKGNSRLWIFGIVSGLLYFVNWRRFIPGVELNVITVSNFLKNMIFFALGQILFHCEDKFLFKSKSIALAIVGGGGIASFNYLQNMAILGTIPDWLRPAYQIMTLLGKIMLVYSIIGLSRRIGKTRLLPILGRNSYGVYLLHQPFCCAFLGEVLYNMLEFPALVVIVICILLSFIIPMTAIVIIKMCTPVRKAAKMLFNIG